MKLFVIRGQKGRFGVTHPSGRRGQPGLPDNLCQKAKGSETSKCRKLPSIISGTGFCVWVLLSILSPGIGEGSWRGEDNLTRDRTISDLGVWACSWGFVKEWVASENSSLESAWLRMGWFLLQRCSQAAHLELDPNLSPVQFGLLDVLTVLDAGVGCVCVFVAGASLNLSDS